MRFFFFRAFRAYNLPFDTNLAKNTLPKAPEPKVLIMLNEEKLTLLVVISFSSFVKASLLSLSCVFLSWTSSLFGSYIG